MRRAAIFFFVLLGGGLVSPWIAPISASVTITTTPSTAEPGGGTTLFPGHRIVAFYGAANAPSLGTLGEAPPQRLWARLSSQATVFKQPQTPVIPAFELLAFVAQSSPGQDGTYAARIPDATISAYLRVVRLHHGLLILDVQPGRSDFLADAKNLAPWLTQPDVGLALDAEWELQPNQLPMAQLGHTTGQQINEVSSWLATLIHTDRLPQKLLLIHEFSLTMVQNKAAVISEPGLAIVFNMDGFGSRADKVAAYQALAGDRRFYLGFKLFYKADVDIFSPPEVLALKPAPEVIEYE